MKKLKFLLAVGIMISFNIGFSQTFVNIEDMTTCEKAYDISIFTVFGPTSAPKEIQSDNQNSFNLPQHPTWYSFTIKNSGILIFDIIPVNYKDNYDFMLFKDEDNFCEKYKQGKIKAIASNFSPPDNPKGVTGMSYYGDQSDFEKGIPVKEGEKYYLALNNVYQNGKGHTIIFKDLKNFVIRGTITNKKTEKPIKAEISWKNLTNNTVFTTTQTEKKGSYELEILLDHQPNTFPQYELCVNAENFFPQFIIFPTSEANQLEGKEINFQLNKVNLGLNNESLGVIYFRPNDATIITESETILKQLLKFMQLNESAVIKLEGHTNGLVPSTDVDFELSEQRAEVVKAYLVQNGIDHTRIFTEGLGSKNEIFPIPETEEEEGYNRRVEINIVEM
jgi:outer membrane protein OmpA-like peptidoglycan-associated protein